MIEVNRSIILGLGPDGAAAAQQTAQRIKTRIPGGVPLVQTILLDFAGSGPAAGAADGITHVPLARPAAGAPRPAWVPALPDPLPAEARALGRLLLYENAPQVVHALEQAMQ